MARGIFEEQQGVGKRGSAAQNKEERIFGGLRGMVALIPRRRAGVVPVQRMVFSLRRAVTFSRSLVHLLRELPLIR